MVAKCCIKRCRSEQYPGCEMTFHGFPSDENLKTKWIEATGVTGNVKYKRICPLHFKSDDFMLKGKVIRLKQNIIPTFCKPPFRTCSFDEKMIFPSNNFTYMADNQDYEGHNEREHTNIDTNMTDHNNLQDNIESFSLEVLSEDTQKIKVPASIARCKCCLESDKLRSMWQEHCNGGQREVYGNMLTACFALHWSRPEDPKNSPDLICESCIARLKDAVNFKTEVLASEQLLSGQLEAVDVDKLKQERDDVDANIGTEYLQFEDLEHNDNNEVDNDRCDDNIRHDVNKSNDKERNIDGEEEFAVKSEPCSTPRGTLISCNKEEISRRTRIAVSAKRQHSARTDMACKATAALKRLKLSRKAISNAFKNEGSLKMPVRKRINKRKFKHFENITENLRTSVEAVDKKDMSETMAAMYCNLPRELIAKELIKAPKISEWKEDSKETKNITKNGIVFIEIQKIIDEAKKDSKKSVDEVKEELSSKKIGSKEKDLGIGTKRFSENRLAEMKKQANNIAIILESTNATPIRRHGGIGYGCCFCDEEFPDAADLKQHTIKEHDVKTKRNYAKGKRPSAYLVKLDITGLKCNLCGNTIESLDQLYDHLIEVHKKLLYRNAKNYIVPFKFDQEELRCLFCEFICNSFKGLLEHMSIHYRNHICEICDAGFLTKNNLFNHAGRHKKGTFKCDYCPKVFDTSSKKAGHQRLVHSSTNGVNRCGYCGEMFGTYRRKEKHLITVHGITLKKLKCKACDKTFETQTALRIHTKRDHLIERRFKCSVCDKLCFTNVQLNQHTLKHTGVKKFQCTICLKTYGRKSTLREHMRIHENDRRFKCELCGMAFVQKCSWRGHMLSKHGQQA